MLLTSYLKIAWRNILRHKGYAALNVCGLGLGMACCLLITLWVIDEFSYDRFHEKADQLHMVIQDQYYNGEPYRVSATPHPMAAALEAEIPEVLKASRYIRTPTLLFRFDEHVFFEDNIRAVDPSFLHMFSFPLIKGDVTSAFDHENSLVISASAAKKYFGDKNAVGQAITINNTHRFLVTGVYQDAPPNSSFDFDFLISYSFLELLGRDLTSWTWNSPATFVEVHSLANIDEVGKKITEIRYRHAAEELQGDQESLTLLTDQSPSVFAIMPLTEFHLFSSFGFNRSMGAIQYVYIFSAIALFVLLIACINFMNLSTARSANRAREVGLRKVAGATRPQLIAQFYGESMLLSCAALSLGIILAFLLLPTFNDLSGKQISGHAFVDWHFILGMLAIALITGAVSGSYPAIFLSRFQPVAVFRGTLGSGAKGRKFRRALVLIQFSLSVALIICTGVVTMQLHFLQNKKLGYDKHNLVYTPLRGDTTDSFSSLKTELEKDPRILSVSGTRHRPTSIGSNSSGANWDGKNPENDILISFNAVNFDFVETMKIEITEGRSFSRKFGHDENHAFLINETLANLMNQGSPVNKPFSFLGIDGIVVGVMKDFHYSSARNAIEPLALYLAPDQIFHAVVRLDPENTKDSLAYFEETWNQINPGFPFDYQFVDEEFAQMYRAEERMSDMLQKFSILAVLIACLGLFGLASFTCEQRTKEIGVRKVLGASIPNIVVMLSKEYTRWVLIANLIAWPITYYIAVKWLESFPYRIGISIALFVLTGLLTLAVAWITVAFQSIKAALNNPADSMRYE